MMIEISAAEVAESLAAENSWWEGGYDGGRFQRMPRRAYFADFHKLVTQTEIRRAVILMGPRRVGKTVMVQQSIFDLIAAGVSPKHILYVSIDTPTYTGYPLERLVKLFLERNKIARGERCFVFFDEVQYLKNWETHLKVLVDRYDWVEFVASGSAAAALKLASSESGAGRFTDFMLPPLTFAEYLRFIGKLPATILDIPAQTIDDLNLEFINYLNYGGYPEAVVLGAARDDPGRFIKSDIIDKVLLRDMPSLYGIADIQELNRLFTALAYNTGNVISLEKMSQSSGVSKPTILRYLEYLEAAFLIKRVRRVDERGNTFAREREFKVYLTNPSMRAALFHPVTPDSEAMGRLVETAVFSQLFHSDNHRFACYARWTRSRRGIQIADDTQAEVDLVRVNPGGLRPLEALEIKWTDRFFDHPADLVGLIEFAKMNGLAYVGATTRTKSGTKVVEGIVIHHVPCALYCYDVATMIHQ